MPFIYPRIIIRSSPGLLLLILQIILTTCKFGSDFVTTAFLLSPSSSSSFVRHTYYYYDRSQQFTPPQAIIRGNNDGQDNVLESRRSCCTTTTITTKATDDCTSIDRERRRFLMKPSSFYVAISTIPSSKSTSYAATTTALINNNPDKATRSSSPPPTTPQSITIPLQSTGTEYLITYLIDGSPFRAILDTGSPFLTIPDSPCGTNTRTTTGCYRQQGVPSGYSNTIERFDGFEGNVEWRRALFGVSFLDATGSLMGPSSLVFGVVDDDITSGPGGGVFFGLIKYADKWIRPTFLGQTNVSSMVIDLGEMMPSLTLSTVSRIGTANGDDADAAAVAALTLTNHLRQCGDPVQHYCVLAHSVTINGMSFVPYDNRSIYVIFDTGVTGMVVSQRLFDDRYNEARRRREKSLWGDVRVTFLTEGGVMSSVVAKKPLTTTFDPRKTWRRFKDHVIVVGLAFLDGRVLTVDIDDGRLLIQ